MPRIPSDATKLRSVKTELKEERARLAYCQTEIRLLRQIGQQMANVFSNLSQEASESGKKLDPVIRTMMKGLQESWDRIRSTL
jgi:vacuolar-type H+-ATPase subunit D/Vma8